MRDAKNLIGLRFGKLTVLKRCESRNRRSMWLCKCDCGNEVELSRNHLSTGNTKSCGCLRKDAIRKAIAASTKHNGRHTRLYSVWITMKQRCYNNNATDYENYGGRGIVVCETWRDSFEEFKMWAYENGYDENASKGICTLERKDVDGNYEPSNCKWTTMKEQSNNKRNNVFISFNGEIKTVSQLSQEYGVKYITLYNRIKRGWSIEKALNLGGTKNVK